MASILLFETAGIMPRTSDQRRAELELERVHAQASSVVLDGPLDRPLGDGLSSLLLMFQELVGDALETLGTLQTELPGEGEQIADLAFGAALELKGIRARIEQARQDLATCDGRQLCEIARGTLRRCTRVVIEALCDGSSSPLENAARADLAIALAIRRRYSILCRRIQASAATAAVAADPESLAQVIRKAGNALAATIGAPSFRSMRIDDRRILRSLHERAVAWFKRRDLREGRQLCSDLSAAAEILRTINQRQELREHDRGAVGHALACLAATADRDVLVDALQPLAGRDPMIDRALGMDDTAPPTSEELRDAIARLATELAVAPADGQATGDAPAIAPRPNGRAPTAPWF